MVKFQEALYEDLSLYVRQLAWLNTTTERAELDKTTGLLKKRFSRLEKYRQSQGEDAKPSLPPIIGDSYLYVEWLFQIGPVLSIGMGPTVISQSEIMAWQFNSGIRLQPWEIQLLRRLSLDYLTELNEAEHPLRPAPWAEGGREIVSTSIRDHVRRLSKL